MALARVLLDIPLRSLKSMVGSMEMVMTGPVEPTSSQIQTKGYQTFFSD
jgi:hypothetical protein